MIEFDIPIRTVAEKNKREHWAVKARRVKEQRDVAYYFTCSHMELPLLRLPKSIILTRIAPGRLDDGNLSVAVSAVQDGICDALEVNDGDPRITWKYAQEKGKEYAVKVQIKERSNGKVA